MGREDQHQFSMIITVWPAPAMVFRDCYFYYYFKDSVCIIDFSCCFPHLSISWFLNIFLFKHWLFHLSLYVNLLKYKLNYFNLFIYFYSFIHMCILHCLGHFSHLPPSFTLFPPITILPSRTHSALISNFAEEKT
jgi:hypothetical protein